MFGLFGMDYRVASLSTSSLTNRYRNLAEFEMSKLTIRAIRYVTKYGRADHNCLTNSDQT